METSTIVICLIILIIFLIGIYYSEKEHFDIKGVFKGLLAGSLLYLCWPCLSTCCSIIILVIAIKFLKK